MEKSGGITSCREFRSLYGSWSFFIWKLVELDQRGGYDTITSKVLQLAFSVRARQSTVAIRFTNKSVFRF